jgi:hypothetical protein
MHHKAIGLSDRQISGATGSYDDLVFTGSLGVRDNPQLF